MFNISNCTVNKSIDSLIFEASIDEESINGTQFNVSANIYASPDKVGTENEKNRSDQASIQIINLASHRLYKSIETTGNRKKWRNTFYSNHIKIIQTR